MSNAQPRRTSAKATGGQSGGQPKGRGGGRTTSTGTRASNGRSSIHQDDEGRWHGYVSMGRADNGRVVRRHVRGKTRAEVTAKVEALEDERQRTARRPSARQQLTVGEWLDEWLVIVQRTRKPKTYDNYECMIRVHCAKFRRLVLARVVVRDVDDLLHHVARRAPHSAVSLHRILRASFNVAVKRGVMVANPCQHAVVPRVQDEELEPYDLDQCRRILAAAAGHRQAARWSVALALGLRQGEALGLQWRDIDFDGAQLRVRRQLQRPNHHHGCDQVEPDHYPAKCPQRTGGGWMFEDVKSRAGRRTLALPAHMVDQLRHHRREQAAERIAAGSAWQEHDLVFPRHDGLPQNASVDTHAWTALVKRAGVPRLRLHYARHTAATMLLAQGVDGRVVMGLLGWSQASLLTRYQHVIDPMRRDAASRLGAAYWPASS